MGVPPIPIAKRGDFTPMSNLAVYGVLKIAILRVVVWSILLSLAPSLGAGDNAENLISGSVYLMNAEQGMMKTLASPLGSPDPGTRPQPRKGNL